MTATSTEQTSTKEDLHEFINEVIKFDMTDFIQELIKSETVTRDMIYFDSESNNTVKNWYLATDWYDDLAYNLCECDISYVELGNRVFIGINNEYDDLFTDPKWIQLCIMAFAPRKSETCLMS